jgi:CheY-like chemotaxis protein
MALRLLIVDDFRESADTLAALLELKGYDVRAVYAGHQAVEAAVSFHPDVFIVDLAMPILDGFQVATQLRSMPDFKGALFVALSGYSDQSHLDEASKAQFDEYLIKPPEINVLLSILSEASGRMGK